jgi:hypothetical protein
LGAALVAGFAVDFAGALAVGLAADLEAGFFTKIGLVVSGSGWQVQQTRVRIMGPGLRRRRILPDVSAVRKARCRRSRSRHPQLTGRWGSSLRRAYARARGAATAHPHRDQRCTCHSGCRTARHVWRTAASADRDSGTNRAASRVPCRDAVSARCASGALFMLSLGRP